MFDTMKFFIPYLGYITTLLTILTIVIGYLGQRSHKRYDFFITKTEANLVKWYSLIQKMNIVLKEKDQRKKSKEFIIVMKLLQQEDSPIATEFDKNISFSFIHLQVRYDKYKDEITQDNLNELWSAFQKFITDVEQSIEQKQKSLFAKHEWYMILNTKSLPTRFTIYILESLRQIFRFFALLLSVSCLVWILFIIVLLIMGETLVDQLPLITISSFTITLFSIGLELSILGLLCLFGLASALGVNVSIKIRFIIYMMKKSIRS